MSIRRAAILFVEPDLSHAEEKRLADCLSTIADEILKGERKKGLLIQMDVINVEEGLA